VEREIALEKKGVRALKSYLAVRVESFSNRVFLNYQGYVRSTCSCRAQHEHVLRRYPYWWSFQVVLPLPILSDLCTL
jgi:hypothetical protein